MCEMDGSAGIIWLCDDELEFPHMESPRSTKFFCKFSGPGKSWKIGLILIFESLKIMWCCSEKYGGNVFLNWATLDSVTSASCSSSIYCHTFACLNYSKTVIKYLLAFLGF